MQLSDFKTYVKQDFKRTDKDTEIVQAYNDMILWVASQMPHSGYKYQSYINTQAGIENVLLPTDLVHLIHPIRLLEGSSSEHSGFRMKHLSKEEYDFQEPNPNRSGASTGEPSAYTIFARAILLTPVPDSSVYLLEINWAKRPVDQSGDSDTIPLGSEWNSILKSGVLERLYAGLGLLDESQFWGGKYHGIVNGDDQPIGLAAKLFEIERDLEASHSGCVRNNIL